MISTKTVDEEINARKTAIQKFRKEIHELRQQKEHIKRREIHIASGLKHYRQRYLLELRLCAIIALRESGYTYVALGKMLGLHKARVSELYKKGLRRKQWLEKAGRDMFDFSSERLEELKLRGYAGLTKEMLVKLEKQEPLFLEAVNA